LGINATKSAQQIHLQAEAPYSTSQITKSAFACEQTAAGSQRPYSKQEWQAKGIERNTHGLPGLEILDLMNRAVTAFVDLPLRMARCRTPLDAWSKQTQLLRNIAADCQSVTFRMMTGSFVSLPQSRPRTRRKSR
jgi:hypothetical protein